MPLRSLDREQAWLFPPTLDEMVPDDHPARFAAAFVDGLDRSAWSELGMNVDGEPLGSPAYHPRCLLSVWIYGFMTGVRSSRKLEAACRDQIPYLWLTGKQHPDHNTLWRFYREHRKSMRKLLKRTVRTAMSVGLIDLAIQAVDGTKVMSNGSKDRTYDAAGLERLLERTEKAIREIESQNESGEEELPARLPQKLRGLGALQEQVKAAMKQLEEEEGRKRINLTDEDAGLMKTRSGMISGYNAQAMVSPLDTDKSGGETGLLITAADVTTAPEDSEQLVPMLEQAEENTGELAEMTGADGSYHSGANLAVCAGRNQRVVIPEARKKAMESPYFKDRFGYDEATDSYICPEGQTLRFTGTTKRKDKEYRVYRASGAKCRRCPAFGECTKDQRHGRALWIGPYDQVLRRHREWMATEEAKGAYKQRKELPEPAFGILKERQGGRRFLLRGIMNVRAEWDLLATAFNLRTLWKVWAVGGGQWWSGRWENAVPRERKANLAQGLIAS